MRRMLALVVVAVLGGVARAEDPGFSEPIVALTIAQGVDFSERRATVFIALYPDGHVARGVSPFSASYDIGMLSPDDLKAVIAELPLARIGALHALSPFGNDGVTECILVRLRGRRERECYWPSITSRASVPAPPKEMVEIWRRLAASEPGNAVAWNPKNVVVSLSKPRAGCPVVDWPELTARVRGEGTQFEVDRLVAERLLVVPLSFPVSCSPQVAADGTTYSVRTSPAHLTLPAR